MATDEFQILQNNKSAIINRVAHQTNPGWFSRQLQEKGMISAENASAIVNNVSLSIEDKVDRLIQAIESLLRYGPNPAQLFQEFVIILQSEPPLEDLAQKLQIEQHRRILKDEEDEPERDDTEESKLIHIEERRDLHLVTQVEQSRGFRCPQPNTQCVIRYCCCGLTIIIAGMILFKLVSANFDVHLRVNRDTEKQITKSLVPYGVSREDKLIMEQELFLWLSCFIICTPWILAQYISKWKATVRLPAAGSCFLLLVGTFYIFKDFECFKIGRLFWSTLLSLVLSSLVCAPLSALCICFKHFCLRVFVVLLMVKVILVLLWLQLIVISTYWEQFKQWEAVIGLSAGVLIVLVPPTIFTIFAKILVIYDHRTLYLSSMYLSILGVLTTFTLSSALLLTVSLDGAALYVAALYVALLLLLTNLVLLTATTLVTRLPSNFRICFQIGDIKFFQNLVVCFGIFIGIRNLLVEALLLKKIF